jgi:hypothetical protein
MTPPTFTMCVNLNLPSTWSVKNDGKNVMCIAHDFLSHSISKLPQSKTVSLATLQILLTRTHNLWTHISIFILCLSTLVFDFLEIERKKNGWFGWAWRPWFQRINRFRQLRQQEPIAGTGLLRARARILQQTMIGSGKMRGFCWCLQK